MTVLSFSRGRHRHPTYGRFFLVLISPSGLCFFVKLIIISLKQRRRKALGKKQKRKGKTHPFPYSEYIIRLSCSFSNAVLFRPDQSFLRISTVIVSNAPSIQAGLLFNSFCFQDSKFWRAQTYSGLKNYFFDFQCYYQSITVLCSVEFD